MTVLLPNPVGMATTHMKRCFYCASIITYEARSECIDFFCIFLHVHRTRAHPVLVHHAFGVEVGESRTFMYVRQHGPVVHQKSTVLCTSAPPIVPGTCPRRSRFDDCSSLLASPDHSTLNTPDVLLSYTLRAMQHGSVPAHRRPASRQRT